MNHEHPQVRFVTRPEELAALIEAMAGALSLIHI